MNLLEHYVTEIKSEPYEEYGKWWVDVIATCYGHDGEYSVLCETLNHAKNVNIGYVFMG